MASTSASSHLSYPAPEAPEGSTSTQRATSPPIRELVKNRLYVGNLHPTVDEYTLIQIFSKFGKLARMDYLFHKTGVLRGKPRGYAFVEYTGEEDAAVALEAANGKVLRGRHIAVTYAHQAPLDAHAASRRALPHHQQQDAGRPTTLSLLKSAPSHTRTRTGDKIAQMEAKLQQIAQETAAATSPDTQPAPAHPSLPAKPGTIHSQPQPTVKAAASLTPLPRIPKPPSPVPSPSLPTPAVLRAAPPRKSNAMLKGVKIVRKKDRGKEGTGRE